MSKFMRKLSMVLAVMLLLTAVFAGCGGQKAAPADTQATTTSVSTEAKSEEPTAPAIDTSEEVELKMYMVGDKAKDTDMIVEEINKLMKPKINATLKLDYMAWGDWATKYPLVFAAGEDFDGIYTAHWSFYGVQAQKNGFYELTEDFIKKYAPDYYADTPKDFWDQAKIRGKVYMVPENVKDFNTKHIAVRDDLMKKYNIPEITSIDGLDAYFEAISKNEKGMVPVIPNNNMGMVNTEIATQLSETSFLGGSYDFPFLIYSITNPGDATLKELLDLPEYMGYIRKVREWNQKGYIAKNALTNTVPEGDNFKAGKCAFFMTNLATISSVHSSVVKDHPDWGVRIVDGAFGKKVLPYASTGNGFAIHASSKYPERMMMAINLLKTDKEINFLANRGIKGTHWDYSGTVSENERENTKIDGPKAGDYNDSLVWATNTYRYYPLKDKSNYAIGAFELDKNIKETRGAFHPFMTFTFNDENFKNELAAIKNVIQQYGKPLEMGFIDPDKGMEKYRAELKKAGYDKVMEEMRKQADAFMKER